MQPLNRWAVAVLIISGLGLAACQQLQVTSLALSQIDPASVERLEGTDRGRVTLTAREVERLDIQTAVVREVVESPPRTVVPYSAVLYDAQGDTWVYTNPDPLVFVRHPISVDNIDGDLAVLSAGPPPGAVVVTVGGDLLFGAEFAR